MPRSEDDKQAELLGIASGLAEAYGPMVSADYVTQIIVCVPQDYSDEKVLDFAAAETGKTPDYWRIVQDEEVCLNAYQGMDQCEHSRVACKERSGYVHLLLDAL